MSSNNIFSRNNVVVAVAVSAGVLIGAAGIFIYNTLVQKKKLKVLKQHTARLDLIVSDLQREFLLFRNSTAGSLQNRKHPKKSKRTYSYCSSRSEYDTADEMYSTTNTDDDEFYDLNSDDESLIESLSQNLNNSKRKPEVKLFEEVDALMKGNDEDHLRAFDILKKHEFDFCENSDFLWRFAKAHKLRATVFGCLNDVESKKKFVFDGLSYASKAVNIDETNPDAHKWFAILTGMQGEFLPIKEKIQCGYVFYKHIRTALENKPDDYSLHYSLARFKFEIASTSWLEKKIASSLFAELPPLTYADAIPDLHAAEELNPTPWKENRLLLAKCYIGEGNYNSGIEWLCSAKDLPSITAEDETCDREIETLLEKYKKYKK